MFSYYRMCSLTNIFSPSIKTYGMLMSGSACVRGIGVPGCKAVGLRGEGLGGLKGVGFRVQGLGFRV